jgi:FeS assembly SUF system regulator
MLRLSRLTDYGTVILSQMAQDPRALHSVASVAAAVELAPATTSKVMKMLAREGLVVSRRGASGGYMLARPPGEISVVDIIDAMEGRVGLTECSVAAGLCTKEKHCGVRLRWQGINALVRNQLALVSLSDMSGAGATTKAEP